MPAALMTKSELEAFLAKEFPQVSTAYNHVDAACIYFVQDPHRYDVIVTDNLFGDILTDLAAAIGELWNDPQRRSAMGERGRALVEREYGWRRIAGQVEELYRSILAASLSFRYCSRICPTFSRWFGSL